LAVRRIAGIPRQKSASDPFLSFVTESSGHLVRMSDRHRADLDSTTDKSYSIIGSARTTTQSR